MGCTVPLPGAFEPAPCPILATATKGYLACWFSEHTGYCRLVVGMYESQHATPEQGAGLVPQHLTHGRAEIHVVPIERELADGITGVFDERPVALFILAQRLLCLHAFGDLFDKGLHRGIAGRYRLAQVFGHTV